LSLNTILATAPLTTSGFHLKATGTTIGNSLIWDNGTNVGIGNTNTTYKLEVTGTAKISTSLLVNDISISSSTMQASGNYYIGCNNANFIQFYTSNTDRMAITAAGNVGIGTTSPNQQLTLKVVSTNNSLIAFQNAAGTATTYFGIGNATGDVISTSTTADTCLRNETGNILFATNGNTERMRITSGGQIYTSNAPVGDWSMRVIGSSSTNNSYGLKVLGGTSSSDIAFGVTSQNGAAYYLQVRGDSALFLPQQYSWDITGGTTRTMQIRSDGLVGYITSIRASKANIISIETSNWLNQLNPVNFNYRKRDEDNNYTNDLHSELEYGLIAEEVEAINSDMVFYDIKEDGSKELRGVSYEKLIIPILKLVQELSKQNEELSNRLIKLESK